MSINELRRVEELLHSSSTGMEHLPDANQPSKKETQEESSEFKGLLDEAMDRIRSQSKRNP